MRLGSFASVRFGSVWEPDQDDQLQHLAVVVLQLVLLGPGRLLTALGDQKREMFCLLRWR